MPASTAFPAASFLNCLQWIAPGGFTHLRAGWDIVSAAGVLDKVRDGVRRADCSAEATDAFRNDVCWRNRALESGPTKRIHHAPSGGFVWHPRLPDLEDKALSLGRGAARAIFTDASGSREWGATLGGHFLQGRWSNWASREGINWKVPWVLE